MSSAQDKSKEAAGKEIRFYASAEEQDLARLKEALSRTPTEKFAFLMNLMKLGLSLKKGKLS